MLKETTGKKITVQDLFRNVLITHFNKPTLGQLKNIESQDEDFLRTFKKTGPMLLTIMKSSNSLP